MAAPNATGVFKQVAYKREVTFGTIPVASAAQLLRRVQFTVDLSKDTYQSNEIRPDLQISDYRHGVRRVKGSLQGELSPGTYADFFAIAMKRDFTAGVAISAASITIAGTGPTYTLTRAAGSYLTDGFKIGDVIRLSVGTFNAANITKNLWITALTATVATVMVLNASALVAEGPITSATVTVFGKKTYIPTTGHTDLSMSMEPWFNDISQSEVYSGVKVDKIALNLPPTGMATAQMDLMGQNITTAAVRYFTSPTAITTTGVLAAVNGLLMVNGVAYAIVTGLSINIDPGFTDAPVVGSNIVPTLFPGPVMVTGQFTAYFVDNILRDLFVNETESSLQVCLSADNTAASNFIAFTLPRIKLGGQQKSDGTGGIIQTFPFTALINNNGGAGTTGEQTTVVCQDSAA
jgi:hypothetical protein